MKHQNLITKKRTLHREPSIEEYSVAFEIDFSDDSEPERKSQPESTPPQKPQPESAPPQKSQPQPENSGKTVQSDATNIQPASSRSGRKVLIAASAAACLLLVLFFLFRNNSSNVPGTPAAESSQASAEAESQPLDAGAAGTDQELQDETADGTLPEEGKTAGGREEESPTAASVPAETTSDSEQDEAEAAIERESPASEELIRSGDDLVFTSGNPDFAAAADCYKQAAEEGSAAAQLLICDMYLYGIGVEKDLPTAMHYFSLASEQSFDGVLEYLSSAQETAVHYLSGEEQQRCLAAGRLYLQGLMHACGAGTKKDYETAVSFYEQAADAGETRAQIIYSALYYRGIEVGQDYEKSERYEDALYGELSDQEWVSKCCNPAYFIVKTFTDSIGCECVTDLIRPLRTVNNARCAGDILTGFTPYRIDDGSAPMPADGSIPMPTDEEVQDFLDFLQTLRLLSDGGDGFASLLLASEYYNGRTGILEKDDAQAEMYGLRAIRQGSGYVIQQAISGLNELNSDKEFVFPGDSLEREAEKDDPVALQLLYEHAVENGSKEEVSKLLSRLEEAGSLQSLYYLGYCYEFGTGVAKDFNKAADYYRRSAEQGLPQSALDSFIWSMDRVKPIQGIWMADNSAGDIYYFHNDDCDIYVKTEEGQKNNTMDYTLSGPRPFFIWDIDDENAEKGIRIVFYAEDSVGSVKLDEIDLLDQFWLYSSDPDVLECHWGEDGDNAPGNLLRQENLTLDDLNIK